MVRHIVMWKLAPDNAKANGAEIRRRLEALVGQIDGLRALEVRPALSGEYDLCLVSLHDSIEALNSYREHPLHKEVQQFVHACIIGRISCDCVL